MSFSPELIGAVPENAVRFLGHAPHRHDQPHLVHLVIGQGVLTLGDREVTMEPRSCVWLAAGVLHGLRLSGRAIALGPVLAEHVTPEDKVEVLGVVPAIHDLMLARMAAAPRTPEQLDRFTHALEEILLGLRREPFAVPNPRHPVARRVGERAMVSAEQLLELVGEEGVSVRQVQRLFLAETGMTFSRWRRRRRLGRAVRVMASGGSASTAARIVGYASSRALLRAMSAESGVPVSRLPQELVRPRGVSKAPAP